MSNTKNFTVRLGQQTYEIIKYTVVEQQDEYDSVKRYVEESITEIAPLIRSLVAGGQTTRQLIRHIGSIRGIDETLPDDDTSATIKGESISDKRMTIEISDEQHQSLDTVGDELGSSASAAVRRCIYGKLAQTATDTDILQNWQQREIRRKWTEIQNGFVLPQHRCHEILTRRFVVNLETTTKMIDLDPERFNDFAEEYVTNFHQTDGYTNLKQTYGDSTLMNVENVIEEKTEYSPKPSFARTGFLEDFNRP